MRAALRVAGIEVAVAVPRGRLEALIASRYGRYLGPVENPVLRLALGEMEDAPPAWSADPAIVERRSEQLVEIDHPEVRGCLDLDGQGTAMVAAEPASVDYCLRLVFSLLAHHHDAVVLEGCGVIVGESAHVVAGADAARRSELAGGAGHRPLLSDEYVLVRKGDDGWVAASTPFRAGLAPPCPPREAPLAGVWTMADEADDLDLLGPGPAVELVLAHAVMPGPDLVMRRHLFELAADLVAAVPVARLATGTPIEVWEAIDAAAA